MSFNLGSIPAKDAAEANQYLSTAQGDGTTVDPFVPLHESTGIGLPDDVAAANSGQNSSTISLLKGIMRTYEDPILTDFFINPSTTQILVNGSAARLTSLEIFHTSGFAIYFQLYSGQTVAGGVIKRSILVNPNLPILLGCDYWCLPGNKDRGLLFDNGITIGLSLHPINFTPANTANFSNMTIAGLLNV